MSLSVFGGHSSPSLRFSLMLTGVAVTAPAEAVGASGPLSPGLTNQETPGRVLKPITKQTRQTTLERHRRSSAVSLRFCLALKGRFSSILNLTDQNLAMTQSLWARTPASCVLLSDVNSLVHMRSHFVVTVIMSKTSCGFPALSPQIQPREPGKHWRECLPCNMTDLGQEYEKNQENARPEGKRKDYPAKWPSSWF